MGHYLIDESRLDVEQSRAIGIRLLDWAVARAEGFELTLDPALYADPGQHRRLAALGQRTSGSAGRHETIVGAAPPADFVAAVTAEMKSLRPVSSDLCCVEDISLHRHGLRFYLLIDYGRTQLMELDDAALAELRQVLGVDAAVLLVAPDARG